jgi:hypothetical protein
MGWRRYSEWLVLRGDAQGIGSAIYPLKYKLVRLEAQARRDKLLKTRGKLVNSVAALGDYGAEVVHVAT